MSEWSRLSARYGETPSTWRPFPAKSVLAISMSLHSHLVIFSHQAEKDVKKAEISKNCLQDPLRSIRKEMNKKSDPVESWWISSEKLVDSTVFGHLSRLLSYPLASNPQSSWKCRNLSTFRTSNWAINLKPPGLPASSSAGGKKNSIELEDISQVSLHHPKKKSST